MTVSLGRMLKSLYYLKHLLLIASFLESRVIKTTLTNTHFQQYNIAPL
jgi:hypothetical protein